MKDTVEVQESDTWNRFLSTGSVEAYLQYVADRGYAGIGVAGRVTTGKSAACESATGIQNKQAGQAGDSPHAGFYTGNGNYIETDAYR